MPVVLYNRPMTTVRPIAPADYPLLSEFLYLSLHVPPGAAPFPREILNKPEISHYLDDFGRLGDVGVVAEAGGRVVGAAWARVVLDPHPGYGNVDAETPELVLAVLPDHRGRGVGTCLMASLFPALKQAGYSRLSLSVQKSNRAVGLYRRLGFATVRDRADDLVMVRSL